jgi:hypothetical protein
MPPPLRNLSLSNQNGLPSATGHRTPQSAPLRQASESLRLPPLQAVNDGGRSLESVIMDIHFLGKIATLRQVAHPIKGERSRHRGCIIAVEGDRDTPISAVVGSLVEMLRKTGEFDVKVMDGPRHPEGKVSFESYIEEVGKWHSKAPHLARLLDWNNPDKGTHMQPISEDTRMEVDGATSADQKPRLETLDDAGTKKIPLLVIPNYLVGASNSWAAALPVVDDYSVFNHWQWVATLWRGIPGPDFTLYVAGDAHVGAGPAGGSSRTRTSSSSSDPQELPPPSAQQQQGGPQGQTPQQQRFGPLRTAVDVWSSKQAVEFKEEHGTIIMHKEKGSLDPSAIRRAAFELGEWARAAAGQGK